MNLGEQTRLYPFHPQGIVGPAFRLRHPIKGTSVAFMVLGTG